MTTFITTDTTIGADETIDQVGPGIIVYIDDSDPGPAPSLDLFGAITGQLTSDNPDTITGVRAEGGLFEGASFLIEEDARIVISATGSLVSAYGYLSSGWGPDITNSGFISVTSSSEARGFDTNSPSMNFLNTATGEIHVTGGGDSAVFGVRAGTGEDLVNQGLIEVHGASGPVWGMTAANAVDHIVNSGTIIATDTSSNFFSTAIATSQFDQVIIDNSGLLEADYAIREMGNGGNPITIVNNAESGQIHGNVDLSFGTDWVLNEGSIVGDIFLGAGDDLYTGNGTIQGVVYGGDGNDAIQGHNGDYIFFGDAGDDDLGGNQGNHIFIGGAGADSLGGSGNDTASYVTAPIGVLASLTTSGSNTGDAAGDTYFSIENLAGSLFNDTLEGDAGVNALDGDDGDDVLVGRGGADTLQGGAGIDTADYSVSTSVVLVNLATGTGSGGDAQGDTLTNIENVVGSTFADTLTGDGGANKLDGGAGADTMTGGAGDDTYLVDNVGDVVMENPGEGTDTVLSSITWTLGAALENLTLTSAVAVDGTGNELNNLITGNDADNILSGNAGDDVINAAGGVDTLYGGDGSDTLFGRTAADIVNGDAGNDTLYGGDGDDTVSGGAGNDLLDGGNHNDSLSGGDDNDTLYGRAGTDTLDGGLGADTMFGGAGDDIYIIDNSGDVSAESSNAGNDTIMASVTFGLGAYIENLTLTGVATINGNGNILANTLTGNDAANVLSGLAGFDTLNGQGGDDTLNGGNGNDTLFGGTGNDILDGGNDLDTLNGGDGNDTLYGRTSADTLNGDAGADTLYGGDGNDILNGGDDNDLLDAGNHNDTLSGGAGDDTLYGRQNDDTLRGDAGSDTLYGGDGVDTLNGGAGADVLNGGNGNDTIIFAAGEANGDTLQDFNGLGAAAGDAIVFSGYGLAGDGATFIQLDATHWQINSADGTIHETIILANGASVDPSDYVFGP